jgi:hypothetical protein
MRSGDYQHRRFMKLLRRKLCLNFARHVPTFYFSFLKWCRTQSTVTEAITGLLYQPRMMDDECGGISGEGNRSTRKESCHSAALSTTNPTWPDPGSNTGLRRGGKPATNSVSHRTASIYLWTSSLFIFYWRRACVERCNHAPIRLNGMKHCQSQSDFTTDD